MAYTDERELSYTAAEKSAGTQSLNIYGNKTQTIPQQYAGMTQAQRQAAKKAKLAANRQVVAEVGDDFGSLSGKLGIDVQDLVTANPNDSTVKAGAAYNVPAPVYNVPTKPDNMTTEEWISSMNPEAEPEPRNYIKELFMSGGGAEGAQPGETFLNKEWWQDLFGTDGSQVGIGVGGTLGLGGIQQPTDTPTGQAEYADFRQAEADAAYKDREIAAMTGSLGITDIKDRTGYYGSYGTEQDLANQAAGDFSQLYNPMYNPIDARDPRDNRPNQRDSYLGGNAANVAALEQMWNDTYLNPENKGRGGGIVGWIEERTGLTIDPETFFTEGASEEVLGAMLAEFGQDELNYLESHGILVAEDQYSLGGGGGVGYGGGNYNYPAVSYQTGGRSSGPSQPYQSRSNIGLVQWSI